MATGAPPLLHLTKFGHSVNILTSSGLPKPNKRHALVMTRFAQDCLNNITKVTKALEGTLGEDTSELTMRIGLHSGPVTGRLSSHSKTFRHCFLARLTKCSLLLSIAGVLRGERSRFQLFGDTVNTASRCAPRAPQSLACASKKYC